MAFYYSKRKLRPKEHEDTGELNIVPYLDILMNLIIFMLLSMTGLAAFGILNVSAPNYGGPSAGMNDPSDSPKLLLMVGISSKGFYVAGQGGVLGSNEEVATPGQGEPTIPKKPDGSYDYAALTARMVAIKSEFPKETKVIISADNDIPYEILVATMDAVREVPGPSPRRLLFYDVTLGVVN